MLDIDHFKAFNDEHGHPAGDRVLRLLAERLSAELRTYDIFCRYGGEEFVLILPGTGKAEALQIAERLRAIVELPVTWSGGLATRRDPESIHEWIDRADQNMYWAKRQGRDRIVS